MNTLDLVLTHHWFDKIASGEKRHEYREIKPYWTKRLSAKRFSRVRFRRGYTSTTMLFELVGIDKTTGPNDLNLPECYCLTLGTRLDSLMDTDLSAALIAWPKTTPATLEMLIDADFAFQIKNYMGIGDLVALTDSGKKALATLRGLL